MDIKLIALSVLYDQPIIIVYILRCMDFRLQFANNSQDVVLIQDHHLITIILNWSDEPDKYVGCPSKAVNCNLGVAFDFATRWPIYLTSYKILASFDINIDIVS